MPWAESIRANTSDAVPKGNGGNKKMFLLFNVP